MNLPSGSMPASFIPSLPMNERTALQLPTVSILILACFTIPTFFPERCSNKLERSTPSASSFFKLEI